MGKKSKNSQKQQVKTEPSPHVKVDNSKFPFVSICTPTFNRRPFYEMIIQCFNHQTYPKDRMEWIIIDDGTDKIEDLVKDIPQVKYFKYDEKMNLGKKRNLMHDKSKGDIIVYMDDDDYYPPERVAHCVETLQKNPQAMVAGSSEMYIYFKHINKMYQFGPYGPNHATAATFAFRREYLKHARYDDGAALAEERHFLKGYTTPFVQMDPLKTILVFSHIHNSFDKKKLLEEHGPNPFVKESTKTVEDFVKEPTIKEFFINKIESLLDNYEPGRPENKPEVLKQIKEITEKRQKMQEEQQRQHQMMMQQQGQTQLIPLTPDIIKQLQDQGAPPELIQQFIMQGGVPVNGAPPQQQQQAPNQQILQQYEARFTEQQRLIQTLIKENIELKEKVSYLDKKMRSLIETKIEEKKAGLSLS
jgi:hypothetical protein